MRRSLALALTLFIVGCDAGPIDTTDRIDPAQRAVFLETTGCGAAADRVGSGIAIGDGLILTAAHLVVRADDVSVSINRGPSQLVTIRAIDLQLDLALLESPADELPGVTTGTAAADTTGRIIEGASSGTVDFTVVRRANLITEEILGDERFGRVGYELDADTSGGDSGSGAYDADNQLIGMVFATSDGSTWITASSEIEAFLKTAASDTAEPLTCDPARSQLDLTG